MPAGELTALPIHSSWILGVLLLRKNERGERGKRGKRRKRENLRKKTREKRGK